MHKYTNSLNKEIKYTLYVDLKTKNKVRENILKETVVFGQINKNIKLFNINSIKHIIF